MEAPTTGIGRLLKEGGSFVVPHHQRDYSWSEDEIDQLFQDVLSALDTGHSEYFIGLMVFMPGKADEYTILDGQQRLATTILVLAAIRGWLKARDYDDDAAQIQSTYIATRELGGSEFSPLLVLNDSNNPHFERFVVREAADDEIEADLGRLKRYDPSRRLLEAVLACRRHVAEIARKSEDRESAARRLYDLVNYFRDAVKVVRLNVQSEANAYTVFETLNDRGLDLSVLDLVKNQVFGAATSNADLRGTRTRWAQMMATLANVPADDFLKAWWTSRYGRIQTAQLFPSFKNKVRSPETARSVSEDMLAASEVYASLQIADDPLWSAFSSKSRERVRALKLLGARQVLPVLLSSFGKFNQREAERLLHLLEVVIVRYQLIGGGRTGRLEIACARLAHGIFDGDIATARAARESLKDVFPGDKEFEGAFLYKQERNNQKAKYILTGLEIQARRATGQAPAGDELVPSGSLTLEHVFPRSPKGPWLELLQQDAMLGDEATFRLGNECLLTHVNRALGGKSFAAKRSVFKQSELLLTKDLAEVETWDRDAIEARQEHLAKLAVAYWRFQ